MAAFEIYDYLSSVTADYVASDLTTQSHGEIIETGGVNGEIIEYDDNSETRIVWDDDSVFYVNFQLNALVPSDAGTIFDWYNDKNKANGIYKSFYWVHPTDGHTYTVRFNTELSRGIRPPEIHAFRSIQMKILGNKP